MIRSYFEEFLPPAMVQNGPNKVKINHRKTIQKINKNKNNSKLRIFFEQVPLPEDRYRRQAPCTDILDSQGLRGAQTRPKMAKNDLIRLLHGKTPPIPKSGGISD